MGQKSKKILIIRLGAIGDVVHTTIIPKAIKEAHPDYEVHYLTQSENAPLLEPCKYIDKIHSWNRKDRKSLRYLLNTCRTLFRERYDIVLNLTNAIRNNIISVLVFPKKIVMRKKLKGLWVEDFFYTAKSAIKDLNLPLTLELGVDKESDNEVIKRLSDYPKPYTMIIPGGNTDKNRQGRLWDIEKWADLSEKILSGYGGTIFVCGGTSEKDYHQQLKRDNVVITTGEYDLAGTSALLSHADLVISGDTGPVHIASGHNVKTLSILGSTSPDKIKPYGENGYYISADTDCKYCWKKKCKYLKEGENITPCMKKVTVQMVMDKIKSENLI